MSQTATAAPDAATDPQIDPRVRAFLAELNKDDSPFWEKPGPEVRAVLTGLQAKTPVDLSGVTISEKTISENGRTVTLYIVKPDGAAGAPPVLLFIHGGVWIAGDFENHKRLVRDLVVGSGAAAVFVEYTPIPDAVFPTQLEQSYAAARWVAEHGAEIGVDGRRIAVAGNSVGGDMSAALALMAKDRGGPKHPPPGAARSRRPTPTSRRSRTAASTPAVSWRGPSCSSAGRSTRRTRRPARIPMRPRCRPASISCGACPRR